jgi:hypothetical protein
MKIIPIISAALMVAASASGVEQKAGVTNNATETATWISRLSAAQVGALKTQELTGESQWGAGADVGVGLNKFVSLHASVLSFEGEDEWRGGVIDEASLGIQASLSRFSTESFLPYVVAGGVRSFDAEDWAMSIGIGALIQYNNRISIGGDYSVRAWFNEPEDSLARIYLQYSF